MSSLYPSSDFLYSIAKKQWSDQNQIKNLLDENVSALRMRKRNLLPTEIHSASYQVHLGDLKPCKCQKSKQVD